MSWEARYIPPEPHVWQGRTDIPADSCFFQHMRLLNLLTEQPRPDAEICFALLGFKSDEGVQRDLGRAGAYEGPTAIRQRLAKLPIQKPNIQIYDVGNIICNDHDLESSQTALADVIALLLKHHMRPIVLGGGHEVAWSQYLAIKQVYAHQRLGLVNFDAHFDLQPMEPSLRASATTAFYQIAQAQAAAEQLFDYNCVGIQPAANIRQAFEIAKLFGAKMILADELHEGLREKCFDFIDRVIDENAIIYTSLSLDVFSPAFAPGVATIQPLGLFPWQVIPQIRQLAASGKVMSYDIVEHVPRYDIDHRTAKLAASIIYEIIHHHHESSKQY